MRDEAAEQRNRAGQFLFDRDYIIGDRIDAGKVQTLIQQFAASETTTLETELLRVKEENKQLKNGLLVVHDGRVTALTQQVEELRAVIEDALQLGVFGMEDRSGISIPEDEIVRQLGERIGYGALMDAASRTWAIRASELDLEGSEFTVGPCAAVRRSWIKKATEALTKGENNDGHTI